LNQKQQGPVPEKQLDDFLRTGAIDRNTLVWHEGMAEWQSLEKAQPTGPGQALDLPPIIPGAASATCAECQGIFPQSDMIQLNRLWVCARCKPVFVQRLAEGAPPARTAGLVWRSDRQMVLRSETPLPDLCVRCNAPANGYRLKRRLYWHHPAFYLLILLSILIYAIVAICVRKKALLHIGLCERHRKARVWTITACWTAALAGIFMLIVGIAADSGLLALLGGVALLGGAIWGAMKGTVISTRRIDNDFVWVKGAGDSFLNQFPEWNGPC
jgi:hypothetical protein